MSYMLTHTGQKFYLNDIEGQEVRILDISHALSNICRFNGQCESFYSVAQHSVMVSEIVAPEHAKQALLHDATEAYLGDMIRPLKALIPTFCDIEKRLQKHIFNQFGLSPIEHPAVKHADNVALAREQIHIMRNKDMWSGVSELYDNTMVIACDPTEAKAMFIRRYYELFHD